MNALLWKALGGAILALVVIGSINYGRKWKAKYETVNLEIITLFEAIRVVTENPKLERPDALSQLYAFGASYDHMESQLKECSERVDAISADGARRQREADAVLSSALDKRREAERVRQRLEQSAREPQGSCLSPTLKDQWK